MVDAEVRAATAKAQEIGLDVDAVDVATLLAAAAEVRPSSMRVQAEPGQEIEVVVGNRTAVHVLIGPLSEPDGEVTVDVVNQYDDIIGLTMVLLPEVLK